MESKHSQFESPLRYPGGKACIFPFMSKLFYENNLIGSSYAEPYAGGAGLALKLLFNEYVNEIYINDLDSSIFSFWKTILEKNLLFCDWLENVDVSIDNWQYYKQILLKPDSFNEFEIACATFYLNRTNISGVIKGGIIGGIEQTGKYKIDARFNKDDLLKRIQRINTFRHRINLSNLDGVKFIRKINLTDDNIFVYVDPPYVQKGADLYMNFYSRKDHDILSKSMSKLHKRWLVSYDNNEFVLNLYKEHQKVLYRLSQSTSNRIGDEIIIFSNQLLYNESMKELKDAKLI